MECTPELFVLLKQLLAVCAREAERAKETEQMYEQIQDITLQINKVLAAMQKSE